MNEHLQGATILSHDSAMGEWLLFKPISKQSEQGQGHRLVLRVNPPHANDQNELSISVGQ